MIRFFAAIVCLISPSAALPDDWPMGGRTSNRNPVSLEKNPPTDWHVGDEKNKERNIKWNVRVGSRAIGGPVVANGLVWVGTNNEKPLEPAIKGDRGVLACFRESDGKFLYQYTSKRLGLDKYIADWAKSGHSGSPVTEKDRLWFITNRREVVCLDTRPLSEGSGPAKEVWKFDLVKELGVYPNSPMIPSHNNLGSPAIHKDWLYIPTGNGVDVDHPGATRVRAPDAPSLVCFNKTTGKVVWKDNSPGKDMYGGHHASPLVIAIDGKVQVIHPQGDGWVRSFEAATGKLIWKFDVNPKGSKWEWPDPDGNSKTCVVATPVFAAGKVYFAVGREPEFTGKPGRLFCIDPSKTGDISAELDAEKGTGKPNPNSEVVWSFISPPRNDPKVMYQTTSSVAVHDGLLILPDRLGLVHCFDAKTGQRYWIHESRGGHFGDPLIVDGKIYVGDDDPRLTILDLSKTLKVLAKREFNDLIVAPPIHANGTLFVLTESRLYAIGEKK